jgi:branched-chain amino acid transport system substrate-binding protein
MAAKKGGISKTTAIIIVAIVVIAGVAGVAYFVVTAPKTSVVIGWVHSMTGPLAGQTLTFDIYYKWIIADYDAKGGLYVPEYGKKLNITYVEYDDHSDINTMLSLTEKLITVDKVDLMFAPVSTAFNLAAFPIYQKYHMPVVALTFGSDIGAEYMRAGNYSYCYSVLGMPSESATQVVQLFEYINTTKAPNELNKVGIIYHSDQHGVEYSLAIHDALTAAGFSVPVYKSYLPTVTDFTPLINTLSAAGVDAVIQCGYEGAFFIKSAQADGYNPSLYMCGPSMETPLLVYNPHIYNMTHAQVNGTMLYDGWPSTAYNTANLSTWATAHLARAGYDPFPASATFYAGLQCLLKAEEKVGLNHTAIMLSLQNDNFTTLVGNTHLHRGYAMECSLAGTICQWQGGNMSQVIWPLTANSSSVMFPKPNWP